MLWFAMILAIIVGGVVGLFTRNLKKALVVGSATFNYGCFIKLPDYIERNLGWIGRKRKRI